MVSSFLLFWNYGCDFLYFICKKFKFKKLIDSLNIFKEFLCYKDPQSHPFITDEEKNYLKEKLSQLSRDKTIKKTPWWEICTSVPMIAL